MLIGWYLRESTMKTQKRWISFIPLILLLTTACTNNDQPTYTISKKGTILVEENFNVIHVYGFSDNRELARQLTDFLNETEPDAYFYFETVK